MNGQVVLVLREADQFTDLLRASGLRVINLPVTATQPIADLSELEAYIARLDDYDGCFFTSPVAAEIFVKALQPRERVYAGKIYVLGERAKEIFVKSGLQVEYRPDANTAGEFVSSFSDHEFKGRTFLFVRGERSMRTVPDMVGSEATVDEVVVYVTLDVHPDALLVDEIRKGIKNRHIDWVCFFSPSAVDSFLRIFKLSELNGIRTAAIGETTAESIRRSGLTVNFISTRASAAEYAGKLIDHITKH